MKRFIPAVVCLVFGFLTLFVLDSIGVFAELPEADHGAVGLAVGVVWLVIGFIVEVIVG